MPTGVPWLPICLILGSMANESTGTGVAELDRALDGLYWGDNVVWVWEGSEPHQQLFYDAIAQRRDDFGAAGYVVASSDPAEITSVRSAQSSGSGEFLVVLVNEF